MKIYTDSERKRIIENTNSYIDVAIIGFYNINPIVVYRTSKDRDLVTLLSLETPASPEHISDQYFYITVDGIRIRTEDVFIFAKDVTDYDKYEFPFKSYRNSFRQVNVIPRPGTPDDIRNRYAKLSDGYFYFRYSPGLSIPRTIEKHEGLARWTEMESVLGIPDNGFPYMEIDRARDINGYQWNRRQLYQVSDLSCLGYPSDNSVTEEVPKPKLTAEIDKSHIKIDDIAEALKQLSRSSMFAEKIPSNELYIDPGTVRPEPVPTLIADQHVGEHTHEQRLGGIQIPTTAMPRVAISGSWMNRALEQMRVMTPMQVTEVTNEPLDN